MSRRAMVGMWVAVAVVVAVCVVGGVAQYRAQWVCTTASLPQAQSWQTSCGWQ